VSTLDGSRDKAVRRALARQRRRSAVLGADAGPALAERVLALPEVAAAGCVAAYSSFGTEPPTEALLDALRGAGKRVLLPVVLDDLDLDWAEYEGPESLGFTLRGMAEPVGRRLGVDAIAAAEVALVPALAVGRDGVRLGKGGGSYDRALARARPGALVVALLWDGELHDAGDLPAEPHDHPVDAVVTPTTTTRL
jgi:5-formyltetrahydrofolate cyclo-ligase